MADSKVSDLTAATSVGGSDVFYIVQTNTSKKVTASTLFANAGNVTLKGNVNLDSSVQLLASPGLIDLSKPVTHFSSDASGGTCTLPNGTANQLKILVMLATSGGTFRISSASSNLGFTGNIVFDAAGDTATMLYTNSKWFMIGGTASIT